MKPCRVCGELVAPWRPHKFKPVTTIHAYCVEQTCCWCGVRFVVKKERRGLFCCAQHQHRWRDREAYGAF